MIIDFHSHILPEMDDGAKNVEMSLEMLRTSCEKGVSKIVATSHCYPYSSKDISRYIEKRTQAYNTLAAAMGDSECEIRMGAEVHLTTDLSKLRKIGDLCIEGTDYILVEMPSSPWNDTVIDTIYKLSLRGITPIIAHAERNLTQKQELLDSLYNLDILVQINAESFGIRSLKKFIDVMMKKGMVHIIGTDMHNLSERTPDMDKAQKYITKRFGTECWEYLMNNAETILSGKQLSYRDLKGFNKKTLFI